MAPQQMWWFKFPCQWVDDPILRSLGHEDRWLYVVLHTIARQSPEPGVILLPNGRVPTKDQLADRAGPGLTATDIGNALDRLVGEGLLEEVVHNAGAELVQTWRIVRWDDEQPKERNSTARVQRSRARKKEQAGHGQGELPAEPATPEDRIVAVARVLGQRDATRRAASTRIVAPARYAERCAEPYLTDPDLRRIVHLYPDVTDPDGLADLYESRHAPAPEPERPVLRVVPYEPDERQPDALDPTDLAAAVRAVPRRRDGLRRPS